MKGCRVLVLLLFFLLPFMATARQKATCPQLPCNSCQCERKKLCGGQLRNGKGMLQLASSGETSCIRCEWKLSVQKNHKVRLTFAEFHLGPGDWVKVYDGSTKRSPLIVKHDTGRHPTESVTSDRNMLVEFQSDGCGETSRIRATYQAIDCGGLIRLDPNNKLLKTAVIKSPRFPRLYPSNANCLWTVVSRDTLLSARITVNTVHTENNKDFVRIYNSLDDEAAVHTYTGRLLSAKRHRVQNSPGLTVRFLSDKSVTEKGFKLNIEATTGVSTCVKSKKLQNGRTVVLDHKRKTSFYCCSGYHLVGVGSSTCVNGRWSPRSLPQCTHINSCSSPDPPDNSYIEGKGRPTALGSIVKFRCKLGFKFAGTTAKVVTGTCACSGEWNYEPLVPRCEIKGCSDPPPPPQPDGERKISVSMPPYGPGTVVTYNCPEGSGLDGIPYRKCNRFGKWEPSTRLHKCIPNKHACMDPGTPGNGTRRIVSFLDGHMASFGCQDGYRPEGSQYRTCYAGNPNDTFWSGIPVTCIDLFKSTQEVAAQWRANFIDRTVQCIVEDEEPILSSNISLEVENTTQPNSSNFSPTLAGHSSTLPPTKTVIINTNEVVNVNKTDSDNSSKSTQKRRKGLCRGRSVTVGEGCLNLIYAVDCSKSINKTGFNYSLDFVGSSVSLFDIDRGQARVALFTYDDKVYCQFRLGQINTTEGTLNAIKSADFCAGSTATRPVLIKIENEILKRRNESCRTAIFILTDGHNNWAGDPMDVADRIKKIPNVEIYTIAFGTNRLNEGVLRNLASNPDYYIPVRNPGDIKKALDSAHDITIDYALKCGTTNAPDCRARMVGGCRSKTGAWPWMVAIYINNGNGFFFKCGGTLIDDCWVLTAAHCFDGGIVAKNVMAVLGDTDRFQKEFTENSYEVEKLYSHSDFDKFTFDNDVALLKLNCKVRYKSQVRKGCLPKSGDEKYYETNTECIVAGWGHTKVANQSDPKTLSTSLKHATLPVQSANTCGKSTNYEITDNMICAGSGNNDRNNVQDACSGDSGGPLFCRRNGPGTQTYVVIGIVSWGDGCGKKGQYGYFTNVRRMTTWIDKEMERGGGCAHSFETCPTPKIQIV